MEDKTFELLTKMYSEFSTKFDKVKQRLDILDDGQRKIDIKLEHDVKNKLDALFEGQLQQGRKHEEHDKRFDYLESKFDDLSMKVLHHDSKLEVLEGGRKK